MKAVTKFLTIQHAVVIFTLLNVADLATTMLGILFFHTYESNPLFHSQTGQPLWWRMVAYKIFLIVAFYLGCHALLTLRRARKLYYVAALTACALVSFVVLWNIFVSVLTLLLR